MSDKHAYLIMAHHRPDLLTELLAALDDPRNDVFLHIDKKSGDEMNPARFSLRQGALHFIPPMQVNWGGASQVTCELELLRTAVQTGSHSYYHLLTGVTYPIRSQDYLHRYFVEHAGEEFVSIDEADESDYDRIQYVHLFNEIGKDLSKGTWRNRIRVAFVYLQRVVGADRFKKFQMEWKKGLAYWSITRELAEHVLANQDKIRQMTKHTILADEIFLQTLIWNSPFRERIHRDESGHASSGRLATWELERAGKKRPGHNFFLEDLDYITDSRNLFAFKFEGDDGRELIAHLKRHLRS